MLASCGPDSRSADTAASGDDAPPAAVIKGLSGAVDSVLLITLDTTRADVMSYTGAEKVASTPVVDRLAEEGVAFSQAHAHNVVTLPSHTNIMTGLYPYQHGVRANAGFNVPADLETAATHFSAAGFATGAFVAAYPLDSRYGLDRGFDVYDDDYPLGSEGELTIVERRGYKVIDSALAWWRSQAGQRRFMWVHLFDAHAPYEPPDEFAVQYPDDPYLAEIAAQDSYLEPLMEEVRSGARTLVVITADHGESLGDHGEATHGFFAYEPTLRVPLVIWDRELEPAVEESPVRHVDLLPTLLDASGLAIPPGLSGRSLFREPKDPQAAAQSYFEAMSPNLNRGWAPLRGMLEGTDKFISVPLPELYDLRADPKEESNLIREFQARAFDLNQLLPVESEWPPERGASDAEEEATLRSLGYITGNASSKESYGPEDDPKNLVQLDQKLHQVIELFHLKRLDEATRLAEEVLAARPMEIGYTLLSQVLLEQGLNQRAVDVMRRALSENLASRTLIRQLGLTLAEEGEAEEALRLLQPLAASGDPEVLTVVAQVLSEGGDQAQAREVLQHLLSIDPEDAVAYERLALVALRSGNWAETEQFAQKAISLNDQLSLPWNYLGGVYYNQGRPAEAIKAWLKSVERDQTNYDALFNIAVVAGEIGDLQQARQALTRFVQEAPAARYATDIARAKDWLKRMGPSR